MKFTTTMLAAVHGTSFTYVIMTWIKYYFYGENEYATHTSLAKVPLFFSGEVCFKELLMKYTTTMQVRILNYVLKLFFQFYQNIVVNTKTHSNQNKLF